jgi:UDP-N-acetylglucosamine 2-epimerase (non-hydrolysing)
VEAFDVRIVHTGQHYDASMSGVFFEQLGLPEPHISLGVASGSHAAQTARILERFEAALVEHRPALVIVVGDVNSTIACALAASKIIYPDGSRPVIAHVEAGLRSRDRSMPEEVNRVLTDAIADLLFTTEEDARDNLRREGVADERIHFVGNVMIDCLVDLLPLIRARAAWTDVGVAPDSYGIVTLHRPANVDRVDVLRPIVRALERIAESLPLVFPVHPRTRPQLEAIGVNTRNIRLVDPLGYVDFVSLLSRSRIVLTDSGGLQEESTFLGVPCLTLRDNTERPVTITCGTNRLVGSRPPDLAAIAAATLAVSNARGAVPPLWDGRASDRIAAVLSERFAATHDAVPAAV